MNYVLQLEFTKMVEWLNIFNWKQKKIQYTQTQWGT